MFVAEHLFSCVFWALVIASVLAVLLFLFGKSLFSRGSVVPTVVVVIVAFVMLFWQGVRLVGAFYLKGYVNDLTEITVGLTQTGTDYLKTIDSVVELEKVKKQACTEYPILSSYINQIELDDIGENGVIGSISSTINEKINTYIGVRIAWVMGVMVLSLVIIYLFYSNAKPKKKSYSRKRSYDWDD